ncbi:sensor histidine kinase [Priestia filamentosa]|uniref:sensor histidine kinase n=2 Tax=Bacillales TaxID=1385 RepID=UPI001FB30D72|nr:histidine kinase dimerization/phospho-acceptor domain-containing protein [Priestia filamentosa]MED3726336.1 histidine kinase dimerization/phospho-acceptor domain-containing protein [Priestia filamentosa]UOE59237.1 sensor histidine kinase [Priestia filamentosa]
MNLRLNFLLNIRKSRNKKRKDIVRSTQTSLTFLFSAILVLFLILFIVGIYLLLYINIFNNQEHELESTIKREANLVENYLIENDGETFQEEESQGLIAANHDHFFYYITNPQGNLLVGDEMVPPLRNQLTNLVKNWTPKHNEIHQAVVQVKDMRDKEILKDTSPDFTNVQEVRLMIAGQSIYYQDQLIGTLYMGKNISFVYDSFKRLPLFLIGIIILFGGVAVYISHLMSKKAMIPITQAFSRQKEFVGDVSRELQTPLSILLSSINSMEMNENSSRKEYASKLLETMKKEVKKMTKSVSTLLTLARSDSGIIEPPDKRFDFRPSAKKNVHSIENSATKKKIKPHLQDQVSCSYEEIRKD